MKKLEPLIVPADRPKHLHVVYETLYDLAVLHEAHSDFLDLYDPVPADAEHFYDTSETIFVRSGVTFLCAAWEACIEDLVQASLDFLIDSLDDPNRLPLRLKKKIAEAVREAKHELTPWELAGDGWRSFLKKHVRGVSNDWIRNFHAPKSVRIGELFANALGVDDILETWTWADFPEGAAAKIIDSLVQMRGAYAHGRKPEASCHVGLLHVYAAVVNKCAAQMSNHMLSKLKDLTGKEPWSAAVFTFDFSKHVIFTKVEKTA